MKYVLNSQEMKCCDNYTIEKVGLPSMVLMERAALAVVREALSCGCDLKRVLVVCGTGNNGGDGMAVARLLYEKGIPVDVYLAGEEEKCSAQAAAQLGILRAIGLEPVSKMPSSEYTMIVDAIFGIGLTREVTGDYAQCIRMVNESEAFVLSVDVPSGINADDGRVMGVAVKADVTVSFAYEKIGLLLYPGAGYAGRVSVQDIGINCRGLETPPPVYTYGKEDLERLPKRPAYSNKGSFGKVLLVAGAANMAGAAYLSAKAAYRMGAGLVRIYTGETNRHILQNLIPEAVLTTYKEEEASLEALKESLKWADVAAIGPGLGKSFTALRVLEYVLKNAQIPLIIDADGLNLLAGHPEWLKEHKQQVIITPHLGEMSRLTGKEISDISSDLLHTAAEFARENELTCVLKDARTVVATPDQRIYINRTGNNGMATGGSGDVLTGVITGLIAQHMPVEEAAAFGVFLHGMAGDAAAKRCGMYGLMAHDLVDSISEILKPQ